MELPHWVLEDIRNLPANFTGQVIVECWTGGVTRRDIVDRRTAPAGEAFGGEEVRLSSRFGGDAR